MFSTRGIMHFARQFGTRGVAFAARSSAARWAFAGTAAFAMASVAQTRAHAQGVNYDAVRKSIAELLDANDYDDGSRGPVLIRLAWHAAGTYDKNTCTGGSNGATMRFKPESDHGANAGLSVARQILEKVKAQHPEISYADLWTLAGAVAVEEMGGPKIKWSPGRTDAVSGDACPADGRLPDARQGPQHLRDIFYKMGFNDQEIVALTGGHCFGRCHADRSGFEGPWTRAPTTFSNQFFTELLANKWVPRKSSAGQAQFNDPSGALMMLPADLALLEDPTFRKYVEIYAKDEKKFSEDFAKAFSKLLALGVPSNKGGKDDAKFPLLLAGVVAVAASSRVL